MELVGVGEETFKTSHILFSLNVEETEAPEKKGVSPKVLQIRWWR